MDRKACHTIRFPEIIAFGTAKARDRELKLGIVIVQLRAKPKTISARRQRRTNPSRVGMQSGVHR